MVWTFIARLVLGLVLSAISYALSPRPKIDKPRAAGLDAGFANSRTVITEIPGHSFR